VAKDTGIDPATLKGIRRQASAIKLRTLDTLSHYIEEKLRAARAEGKDTAT
jgi:hypothetical protein